ncbi:MAG: magnesium transporter [Phycisphaerales bacterium]|nr:MAG: magnesium transporter [Phycisphaerales bacterium]
MSSVIQRVYEGVNAALRADDPASLSAALSGVHAADIAEIYELLADEDRSRLIYALPAPTAAEVVVLLDEADRGEVVEDISRAELTELVSEMEPDDAADVLGELTEEQREDVLEHIAYEQADKIEELLTYDEDTAGGIMTKDLVALPGHATVAEAVREIRASFPDADLHNIYVVDDHDRLFGVVPLRQLVLNDKQVRLKTICTTDPVAVHVRDDQEEVVHVISKYDLAAVPVVDDEGRLLGRITHDDIIDVLEEEADEDMYRMAGLDTAEFETASVVRAAGIRLFWLGPCLIGMAGTATVLVVAKRYFDWPILATLVAFAPMIMAIGGNCGIQISTIIVRGLATGELASSRFGPAFVREGRVALIMAPICGIAALLLCRVGLPIMRRWGDVQEGADVIRVSYAVGVGMTCAILVAASLGMVLPFIFRRIQVDPAIAAGPIVTTVNDVLSVVIFLALASLIIAW